MGYTHYWEDKGGIDAAKYAEAIKDVARFLCTYNRAGFDRPASLVEYDADCIILNGVRPDDCEDMYIPRRADLVQEDFCKTNRRPYDILVTAVLAILAPSGLHVRSDGSPAEFQHGVDLAFKVLGKKFSNPIRKDRTRYVIARVDMRNDARAYFNPISRSWTSGARMKAQRLNKGQAGMGAAYLEQFSGEPTHYKYVIEQV